MSELRVYPNLDQIVLLLSIISANLFRVYGVFRFLLIVLMKQNSSDIAKFAISSEFALFSSRQIRYILRIRFT